MSPRSWGGVFKGDLRPERFAGISQLLYDEFAYQIENERSQAEKRKGNEMKAEHTICDTAALRDPSDNCQAQKGR
jgi:hypothetical protein